MKSVLSLYYMDAEMTYKLWKREHFKVSRGTFIYQNYELSLV